MPLYRRVYPKWYEGTWNLEKAGEEKQEVEMDDLE